MYKRFLNLLGAVIGLVILGLQPVAGAEATTAAVSSPLLTAVTQQLSVERARNTLLVNRLQSLRQYSKQPPQSVSNDSNLLKRANLAITFAQTDLIGISLTLDAARQAVAVTENAIQTLTDELQTAPVSTTPASNIKQAKTQAQLREQQTLLSLQRARVKVLQQAQMLAQQTLTAAQEWRAQLQSNYIMQERQERQQKLDQLAGNLQREQQEWLVRLAQLNQQLQAMGVYGLMNNPVYARLEMRVFEAEERSNLDQIQLDVARLSNRLEDLILTPDAAFSLPALNVAQRQLAVLAEQLEQMGNALKGKINLLQRRVQTISHSIREGTIADSEGQVSLQILSHLIKSNKNQLTVVMNLEQQARVQQKNIVMKLSQQLASRQGFPGLDRLAWVALGEKLLQVPKLTWQVVHNLYKPVWTVMLSAPFWQWGIWLVAVIAWIVLWVKVRRYLAVGITGLARRGERFLTNNTLLVLLRLIGHHLPAFMLIGGFIYLLILMRIPLSVFSIVINLALVGLFFSLLLGLARLLLLENTADTDGHDVRLYHRLRWILPTSGFLTSLTILVHQLPVAYDIQDLFGRLFMLLLLIASLALLRAWIGLPKLLDPYLTDRPYLKRMVRWLSLLVPFTLFSNALVGLTGYVELAWSIAAYQGLFLIVVAGYFLAIGLLGEFMRLLAEQLIRRLRNGWLWSEAILKPLHLILKIALILGACAVLFMLYGWNKHSWVITHISDFLNFDLMTFAESIITPLSLIKLFIIIAIFVWATRWTREFAYRWLFANTKDLGLRNSLAVFSQYMVVTVGIIIALRISGINLTALAFIASAFAVGIGFGLRDLANNFMSGMLLLIERPARVGDYVTVGPFEGEVMHIGMRSMTVLTDDRQEVLVPNAMVFSQAFINWTRRDSIVRILITLKINRIDDPHRVREIILEVVKSIPRVLTKPGPEVFFKEIDDILLKFQLDCFVDMRQGSTRLVRSHILFAIWDRFAAEGIHPPEVPHEILLRQQEQEQEQEQGKSPLLDTGTAAT